MSNKIWLINFCCVGFILFFSIKAAEVWQTPAKSIAAIEAAEKAKPVSEERFGKRKLQPPSVYDEVVKGNLFAPQREEIIIAVDETEPEVLLPEVELSDGKIRLYGVMQIDGENKALINSTKEMEKALKQKGKTIRPYHWIKVGDQLGGLTVKEIRSDRIILKEYGSLYAVLLYNKDRRRNQKARKGTDTTSEPTIINTTKSKTTTKTATKDKGKVSKKDQTEDDTFIWHETPFGRVKVRKKK